MHAIPQLLSMRILATYCNEVEANQPWYRGLAHQSNDALYDFRGVESGQIQLGSILTASDHAASQPKSKLA